MRGSRTAARQRRHYRVRKSVHGSTQRPRLAVYRSNKYIYAQIIDDESGSTITSASSAESGSKSTLTIKSAADVGKRIAARANEAGIDAVVFDRGGFAYHGRVKALADAAREGGLKF